MLKKATLLFMFIVFIMTLFGCETAKGMLMGGFEGLKRDWESTADVRAALTRTDDWMQKNLW